MIRISALCALALLASAASPQQRPAYDILIVHGQVYDGDGRLLVGAEVAIRDGQIVAVGEGLSLRKAARRTIDATGMIVAPGFIDPHTHAGADLTSADPSRRANLAWAFQGVTTVVVGNDGDGLTPNSTVIGQTGTNYAVLSGFGRIRRQVMGDADLPANTMQLTKMRAAVRRDMCAGALGFSAGLYYAPQSFASTHEVIALAEVAGAMGGYYDTHLRDEGRFTVGVDAALEEALEIGRAAKLPLHIAHIKALGPAVWGQSSSMIAKIERARAAGQRVTADQYPWDASGTRISTALLPRSTMDGGMEALRGRLADPVQAKAIELGIDRSIANRGGADRLLITGSSGNVGSISGKTLAQVAKERGMTPAQTAIEILRSGDASLASFNMSATDIEAFAYRDWVVTGSDGSTGHPRMFASFPKAWDDLVRRGKMEIGRFIARSSGNTARAIGLEGRGFLRDGMAADIVVLDPSHIGPMATYLQPTVQSVGVKTLLVAGVPVVENGKYTGNLPGKRLRKVPKSAACSTQRH